VQERNGQPQAQPTPALPEWVASQLAYQAAWDQNVLARYLTPAGGIVQLTDGEQHITGTCTGCPEEAWPGPFHYDPSMTGHRMEAWVRQGAAKWAQGHAEKCRALPRPATP
jgi:hypothetical protein